MTGENFDLREKIENLNENVKRLKKMLKTYMKRIEEAGGNPNDIPTNESDLGMYDGQVEQSIVIRMKDHTEYLGMFEYKKDNEQRIFKALVYGKLVCNRACQTKMKSLRFCYLMDQNISIPHNWMR